MASPYVASIKLTQFAGFLLAGWGVYAWVFAITRQRLWALVSATAYTFAPFHMVNVYVRGDSLSEFWAMGLYPILLFALLRAGQQPKTQATCIRCREFWGIVVNTQCVSHALCAIYRDLWIVLWFTVNTE